MEKELQEEECRLKELEKEAQVREAERKLLKNDDMYKKCTRG